MSIGNWGLFTRCINRHIWEDWGCVSAEDAESNNEAVKAGFRILSAYPIDKTKPCKGFGENTLWVITEGAKVHGETATKRI